MSQAREYGQYRDVGDVALVEVGENGRLVLVRAGVVRLVDHQDHRVWQAALFDQGPCPRLRFLGQASARDEQFDQDACDNRRVSLPKRRGNLSVDLTSEAMRLAEVQQADVDGQRGGFVSGFPCRVPFSPQVCQERRLPGSGGALYHARQARKPVLCAPHLQGRLGGRLYVADSVFASNEDGRFVPRLPADILLQRGLPFGGPGGCFHGSRPSHSNVAIVTHALREQVVGRPLSRRVPSHHEKGQGQLRTRPDLPGLDAAFLSEVGHRRGVPRGLGSD